MRKLLTAVLALAALASVQPAAAQAACSNWKPDTDNALYQGNGWHGSFTYGADNYWHATSWTPGEQAMTGDVMFSSWTTDVVQFTITWWNGSGGTYTGRIDANGFVSGTAVDRWTHARTTWRFRDVAVCAG